jgi:hypothetical protein
MSVDNEFDLKHPVSFAGAQEMMTALEQADEVAPVPANPADMEQLTPYGDEFYIHGIKAGQDVPIGGTLKGECFWIRCDWDAFSEDLAKITPDSLLDGFDKFGELEEQLPNLEREIRLALFACWQASKKAIELLGKPPEDPTQRNNSFGELNGRQGDRIKPLSTSKGMAVCSEYSLLVHHILDKAGISAAVVVGAQMEHPDFQLADRHTYVSLEEQGLVFDPVYSATQEQGWPPKVFRPEESFTAASIKNMATEGQFGKKIKCTDLVTGEERYYGSGAS